MSEDIRTSCLPVCLYIYLLTQCTLVNAIGLSQATPLPVSINRNIIIQTFSSTVPHNHSDNPLTANLHHPHSLKARISVLKPPASKARLLHFIIRVSRGKSSMKYEFGRIFAAPKYSMQEDRRMEIEIPWVNKRNSLASFTRPSSPGCSMKPVKFVALLDWFEEKTCNGI